MVIVQAIPPQRRSRQDVELKASGALRKDDLINGNVTFEHEGKGALLIFCRLAEMLCDCAQERCRSARGRAAPGSVSRRSYRRCTGRQSRKGRSVHCKNKVKATEGREHTSLASMSAQSFGSGE